MENKTISHLNGRAWYRFLKVIFGACFLIALIGFNSLVFFEGTAKKVDPGKTIVRCSMDDMKSFSLQSINLYLDSGAFTNGQFEYEAYFRDFPYAIKTILTACYPGETADIYDQQKVAELKNEGWQVPWTSYAASGDPQKYLQNQDQLSNEYGDYLQKTATYTEYESFTGSHKMAQLDFNFKMFDIVPVFTYAKFIEGLLIGNFLILLVFEAIRRAFYYVVLGSAKPKK